MRLSSCPIHRFPPVSPRFRSSHRCIVLIGVGKIETPNAKKRHRRVQQLHATSSIGSSTSSKATSNNNGADDDGGDENVFSIVSLDKQWFFEAQSNDERDDWVQAIEQQILLSLQNIESSKAARAAKTGGPHMADAASVQAIKHISGNGYCADCDQLSTCMSNAPMNETIVSRQIQRGLRSISAR